MTINIKNNDIGEKMAKAMASGDPKQQAEAWGEFHSALIDQVRADAEDLREVQDREVLAARGYRQLTAREENWYKALAAAAQSDTPQTTFVEILGTDEEDSLMPETIIEDVYRNLKEEHPLLAKMNFQYTGYAVKWVLNDHTKQKAVWGKITDAIKKVITSAFKVIDVHQNKLSAYCFIELGMLDLGPVFMDGYIRTVLMEAIYNGLEAGAVSGSGVDEPIGMDRDIHKGVNFNTVTGYPKKTAVKVKDFTPTTYGALLNSFSKTEDGSQRKFSQVQLICNMSDYLTKIMPASTVMVEDGSYVNDRFPFPTEVIISNEMESGEALLGLLGEYSMFAGGKKGGRSDESTDFEFLDDNKYFKLVQYGTGRAFDNTSFMLMDISELDPLYRTVRVLGGMAQDVVTPADGAPKVEA